MSEYMRSRRSADDGGGHFCRFTFGQFFALLVLEVFTIFFVFYLGAKYGRDLLGLGSAADIAEIDVQEESRVLTTSDPEGLEAAREIMAGTKSPELKDRIRQMLDGATNKEKSGAPEVVVRNRAHEEPAPEPQEELPYSENDQADVKGASVREQDKNTSNASSDASVIRVKSGERARYSVQVGSYPTMQEATSTVEKWKGRGYPAYMMIADIPDRGRWYRVRMGGFENRSDASHYMKELKSRENVEAIVVLNEQ